VLTSSICRLQIRRRKHASGRGQIRKQCFEAWFAKTIGWHTGLHTSRPVWTVTTIGMTTSLQTGRHTDRHVWTPLKQTKMSSVIDGIRQAQCLAVALPVASCSRSGARQRKNSGRQNGYGSSGRLCDIMVRSLWCLHFYGMVRRVRMACAWGGASFTAHCVCAANNSDAGVSLGNPASYVPAMECELSWASWVQFRRSELSRIHVMCRWHHKALQYSLACWAESSLVYHVGLHNNTCRCVEWVE